MVYVVKREPFFCICTPKMYLIKYHIYTYTYKPIYMRCMGLSHIVLIDCPSALRWSLRSKINGIGLLVSYPIDVRVVLTTQQPKVVLI